MLGLLNKIIQVRIVPEDLLALYPADHEMMEHPRAIIEDLVLGRIQQVGTCFEKRT